MELRDEALEYYIHCISSKICNDTQMTQCNKALLYIGAIVHCFTIHASEFIANGLVGDIQTLNCTDLDKWGFSTDLQTDLIQKSKKIKHRLETEAKIEFIGRQNFRKLNVPLNPSITDNLIPAIVGTLLHGRSFSYVVFFTNVLLFYIRFASMDSKRM